MARYAVTTFDVCVSGFERLRNQDEFILVAYASAETTAEDLREQWESDIQACDRGDTFDYDAARNTVREFVTGSLVNAFTKPNPFGLEERDEDDDSEPCQALLFIRDSEAGEEEEGAE